MTIVIDQPVVGSWALGIVDIKYWIFIFKHQGHIIRSSLNNK